MKRIILTGPESSGKSSLALQLFMETGYPLVTEYARTYLSTLKGSYNYDDLILISKRQLEDSLLNIPYLDFMICDTWLMVIKIWSEVRFGKVEPWVLDELKFHNKDNLYLLCRPDIPWVEDPLREHPADRDRLFDLYEMELKTLNADYHIISGDLESRTQASISLLSSLSPK